MRLRPLYPNGPRRRPFSAGRCHESKQQARRRGMCSYLGYYVEGSAGMEYKTHFVPNQLRGPDGVWRDFRG